MGITERRVNELCKTGRISGAYKKGRQWFIPDSAQKPMDKRGHRSVVEPAVSSARKPLPIGVSDYRDACKNYYYVDKTLMIKEFLDERPKSIPVHPSQTFWQDAEHGHAPHILRKR